jgi:hypothetical protein
MIKKLSIDEQKVSNLHIFLIFSSLQPCIDQCENCDVGVELINTILFLFECEKKVYMIVQFLNIVGSIVNLFNDNLCDGWMVLVVVNWIGN